MNKTNVFKAKVSCVIWSVIFSKMFHWMDSQFCSDGHEVKLIKTILSGATRQGLNGQRCIGRSSSNPLLCRWSSAGIYPPLVVSWVWSEELQILTFKGLTVIHRPVGRTEAWGPNISRGIWDNIFVASSLWSGESRPAPLSDPTPLRPRLNQRKVFQ